MLTHTPKYGKNILRCLWIKNKETLRLRVGVFSAVCFAISILLYVIDYFFFHHVTNNGVTANKQKTAGKPFVTNLIGVLATNLLSASALSALGEKTVLK